MGLYQTVQIWRAEGLVVAQAIPSDLAAGGIGLINPFLCQVG
jgi:hypothetical protein